MFNTDENKFKYKFTCELDLSEKEIQELSENFLNNSSEGKISCTTVASFTSCATSLGSQPYLIKCFGRTENVLNIHISIFLIYSLGCLRNCELQPGLGDG